MALVIVTVEEQLLRACKDGDLDTVNRLLQDPRVDPTAGPLCHNPFEDISPLQHAIEAGHLAVVERLLQDKRVDPAVKHNHAINLACEKGHAAIVQRLMQDERVDPSDVGNKCIRVAPARGFLAIVNLLLQDERVDPSVADNWAALSAASNGHSAVLERLLEDERVDPTALHYAGNHEPYPASVMTRAMLPRLAVTLRLPFGNGSLTASWQPVLREYRLRQIDFMEALIARWRWHRGGMCRDVMDHIVSEYVFGMKLRQFVALDAEYVAPVIGGGVDDDDDDDDDDEED
jgi:hypothetical protein